MKKLKKLKKSFVISVLIGLGINSLASATVGESLLLIPDQSALAKSLNKNVENLTETVFENIEENLDNQSEAEVPPAETE